MYSKAIFDFEPGEDSLKCMRHRDAAGEIARETGENEAKTEKDDTRCSKSNPVPSMQKSNHVHDGTEIPLGADIVPVCC
jgi:hypothetical protein